MSKPTKLIHLMLSSSSYSLLSLLQQCSKQIHHHLLTSNLISFPNKENPNNPIEFLNSWTCPLEILPKIKNKKKTNPKNFTKNLQSFSLSTVVHTQQL